MTDQDANSVPNGDDGPPHARPAELDRAISEFAGAIWEKLETGGQIGALQMRASDVTALRIGDLKTELSVKHDRIAVEQERLRADITRLSADLARLTEELGYVRQNVTNGPKLEPASISDGAAVQQTIDEAIKAEPENPVVLTSAGRPSRLQGVRIEGNLILAASIVLFLASLGIGWILLGRNDESARLPPKIEAKADQASDLDAAWNRLRQVQGLRVLCPEGTLECTFAERDQSYDNWIATFALAGIASQQIESPAPSGLTVGASAELCVELDDGDRTALSRPRTLTRGTDGTTSPVPALMTKAAKALKARCREQSGLTAEQLDDFAARGAERLNPALIEAALTAWNRLPGSQVGRAEPDQ